MRKVLLLCLAALSAWADVLLKTDGGAITIGPVTSISCGVGLSCARVGTTGVLDSSGGGGASFFYDAGAGYIFAQESISNPDGGAYIIVARGTNVSGVGPAALKVESTSNAHATTAYIGSRVALGISGLEYGSIWMSQVTSGGARVGLNLTGGGNDGAGAQGIAFSSGAPGIGGTPLGFFNSTGDFTTYGSVNAATTVTTNSASGARGYWSNTGAWADLGGGGSDYFISDGTGIETPGYLEVSGHAMAAEGLCSGTACAGTAFASFPAANTVDSRLRYDSTNSVWRTSDATNWQVVAKEWTMGGYSPDSSAVALHTVSASTTDSPGKVTQLTATNITSPSTTTGDVVFTVYDATNTTVLCTLTKACNVGSGTTTCSGAVLPGVVLRIREDSSGCNAGTKGDFNIVAHFNGG